MRERFWETTPLNALSVAEWEALCDGCARCCLVKLEDEDTAEVVYTDVVCHLLDQDSCRCTHYPERHDLVPDCIDFDADLVQALAWLPESCAYRRVAEGRGLAWWHPLISGSAETVVAAGISVRGRVVSRGWCASGGSRVADRQLGGDLRWQIALQSVSASVTLAASGSCCRASMFRHGAGVSCVRPGARQCGSKA